MEKTRDIKWYRNRVKVLRAKPQPPQRSEEWFRARNTRVTASEAACCLTLSEEICKQYVDDFQVKNFKYKPDKCLSHFDTKEDYIINKCRTFYGENLFKDNIYTLHGKKYEEIATRLYRKEYKTKVIEFGLLPHARLNWLSASPDGITENGVMLEIKCPYSRKIVEGVPPIWYWCQMQYQLHSTDLDECDFLECQINELDTEESFLQQTIEGKQDKGILLNITSEADNSETKYIYPPDSLNIPDEFIEWSNKVIKEYQAKDIKVVPIYYMINKWFCVRVLRRKEWFDSVKVHFKQTIDQIRKYQQDEQLFKDYRESVYLIRNKEYMERYNDTVCLIEAESDDDFEMHDDTNLDEPLQMCLLSDS